MEGWLQSVRFTLADVNDERPKAERPRAERPKAERPRAERPVVRRGGEGRPTTPPAGPRRGEEWGHRSTSDPSAESQSSSSSSSSSSSVSDEEPEGVVVLGVDPLSRDSNTLLPPLFTYVTSHQSSI